MSHGLVSKNLVSFILAGGNSSRMGSTTSKILHTVCGQKVLFYAVDVACRWAKSSTIVLSPQTEKSVKDALSSSQMCPALSYVIQKKAKGTGDAFRCAFEGTFVEDRESSELPDILVLLGDASFMDPEDLKPLMDQWKNKEHDLLVVAMTPPSPGSYGRLCVTGKVLTSIMEAEDVPTEDIGAPCLCNSGIMIMKGGLGKAYISSLMPHKNTENYFLTDCISFAHDNGYRVSYVEGPWQSFVGLNQRQDFPLVVECVQNRLRRRAIEDGAFLYAPETVFFSYDTKVHQDVVIHPYVSFGPGVVLAQGTEVLSFSMISACTTENHVRIGPFSHVRSHVVLESHAEVGSFVEVKKSTLGKYSKAKHLSYLGDTVIGKNVTIGAGVITVNYDGHTKYETFIEDSTLVGCNTTLIAPCHVGHHSTVGAGSVLTKDVPPKHLAFTRGAQVMRPLPPKSKHLQRREKGEK